MCSGFPGGTSGKETTCQCRCKRHSFDLWVGMEKGMATHSSVLAWRIPWTEEPGGLQSVGSQRVAHDGATDNNTGAQEPQQEKPSQWEPSPHLEKSPHSNEGPAQPEIKQMHRLKQCAVSASGFFFFIWGLSLSSWASAVVPRYCWVALHHMNVPPFAFTHQIMDVKGVSSLG